MSVLQRVVKPTTRRGKRILLKKEPQVIEGPKNVLFLTGRNSSEKVRRLVKDLYDLKKPECVRLTKKNDITIFENPTPVESFCKKYETPLFALVSHNKKRPDNLVLGRCYNYSILDMIELHVENYKGMHEFVGSKVIQGLKPCLIFNGPIWEEKEELKQLKGMLIDFFHREDAECVRLQGLEHSLSFTATADGNVLLRSYKVMMKKSGCRTPRVELEEIGPRVDMSLRRSKPASDDLMREACRTPQELRSRVKKNISTDPLGTTSGRVHLGRQELDKIQTRKVRALKKSPAEKRKATEETNEGPKVLEKRKRSYTQALDVNFIKRVKAGQ